MKTYQGWGEAKVDLSHYLQIGDEVDQEMADYFLNVMPPASYKTNLIQIGEPNSHVNNRATYSTIHRADGRHWLYAGHCHRGETVEPTEQPRGPEKYWAPGELFFTS